MLRRAVIAVALLLFVGPLCAEPGLYSPNCRKGETWTRVLTWRDGAGALVNLTGYTAKLQLRDTVSRTVVLELTQASGLTLGGAAGTITWSMTATQTLALPTGAQSYDLRLTSGTSVVTFLVYGYVNVQEAITQ